MDKENNNVVGRLGSKANHESRNGEVRPMPEEASQHESGTHQHEGNIEETLHSYATLIATLGTLFVGTFIICIIVARIWDEDEIKLHVLDMLTRMLQAVARLCGGWAIECEKAYNDHVNALH